ncbi:sulfatase-like hydrolase/transferase [Halobaculum sp. MBLA0147]|uniref:sulfatase-like hydrolase/transferase n=1 Tax=Halobaculum sp. MBLA0147 TaxID=3079934 RepID=UPI0035240288
MSRPNVLLVVLDSVRAANTSLHDHRRTTTPFLEDLADEATVYGQARAPSTWSLPSHASVWTGRSAPDHGIEITTEAVQGHSVWDALSGAGYDTGVFSSNVYVTDHPVGLGEPFDTVCGVPGDVPEAHALPGELDDEAPDGFWYAEQFHEWVDDRDGPWAACVNVMDGHRPYLPHERFDEWGDEEAWQVQREIGRGQFVWQFYGGRYPTWYLAALERLYDGAIRQADAVARRVLAGLSERDALDDTLVVVTSDHGDGLGEPSPVPGGPDSIAHTLGTHEHLTHVPLLVRPPGGGGGRVVDDLATLARFPAAVQRHVPAVAGFDDTDGGVEGAEEGQRGGGSAGEPVFTAPDGESLTYRRPIDGPKLETAREFCGDDHERYVGDSAALYRDLPGSGVEKVAIWRGEAVRVHAHDAQGRIRTGAADPAVVTDRIAAERDGESLAVPREQDEAELPEEVLRHLENIGYK